jgi:hypothetical protein
MVKVNYTSYWNGAIRDPQGRLVAYFDDLNFCVTIDGVPGTITATDIEHAMDLVDLHYQPTKEA